MLLSQTSRYALRAAAFLAERWNTGEPASVAEMSEALGVPRNYLSKILHQLARDGVLSSVRGPRGGFRLGEAPDRVSLASLVEPLEPGLGERQCLLGREFCSDADPCPAHARWSEIQDQNARFLNETTIADLIRPGR